MRASRRAQAAESSITLWMKAMFCGLGSSCPCTAGSLAQIRVYSSFQCSAVIPTEPSGSSELPDCVSVVFMRFWRAVAHPPRWALPGAHMRFALSFLALSLLLVSCSDRDAPPEPRSVAAVPVASDAELVRRLPGTYVFEKEFHSSHFRSVSTLGTNSAYETRITVTKQHTNDTYLVTQEGAWRVKDGYLVVTVTKSSDAAARVPFTTSEWILRADDREFAVGAGSVFRREGQ